MAFSEFEQKRYEKMMDGYIAENRPPASVRHEVDLSYRIKGQSIVIFEIRPFWDNPNKTVEEPVAKATFSQKQNIWKIYWQRSDLKWHRYDPEPLVETLEEFIEIVDEDDYACFFG